MQSSFRVIKNTQVISNGDAVIETRILGEMPEVNQNIGNSVNIQEVNENVENGVVIETKKKVVGNNPYQGVEKIAANFIQNARQEADDIRNRALAEAMETEKKAYEKGYVEGKDNGYQDGYSEGYGQGAERATAEVEVILQNANSVLFQAKEEYNRYLTEKENEIKEMVLNISRTILKREVKDADGLNSMVFDALQSIKNAKMVIIKCNNIYYEELKRKTLEWENQLLMKADIAVIEDNSIEDGKALIEKDNGKVIVDIEYALEKIKEVLNESC